MRSIHDIFLSHAEVINGRHTNGTDKQTNHNYSNAYERILSVPEFFENFTADGKPFLPGCRPKSIRDDVKLMMEIGVADGSSLLAWSEVFPNARCVGMDIMPDPEQKIVEFGHNCEFHQGDFTKLEDCRRAAGGRMFDFICEDATHKLEDSLRALLYLWPNIKHGGLYVIEEFDNIGSLRDNLLALIPNVEIVDTQGPFGGVEPLVVLRKSR